jgi:hypothetical protein
VNIPDFANSAQQTEHWSCAILATAQCKCRNFYCTLAGRLEAKVNEEVCNWNPERRVRVRSIGWRSIGNQERTGTVDGPSCQQVRWGRVKEQRPSQLQDWISSQGNPTTPADYSTAPPGNPPPPHLKSGRIWGWVGFS